MSYIHLSLVRPRAGQEELVRHLLDEIVTFHETQPGYITGYRVEHSDASDRVGRLAIWEHPRDAERAASLEHDIALRSRLNQLIELNSHDEQALYGHWAPKDGAGDAPRSNFEHEEIPAFALPLPAD